VAREGEAAMMNITVGKNLGIIRIGRRRAE
jgi:hypothetical protein